MMSDWLPIESAPKDGSTVLVMYADGTVATALWDKDEYTYDSNDDVIYGAWSPAWLPSHGCGCCAGDNPKAVMWHVLPEPPSV